MGRHVITLYSHGETRPRAASVAGGRAGGRFLARYDNAQTTEENRRNWWATDYLSAKSANSYQVRRQLRIRSRYEVSNNPYLFGICNNNADDLIGTGPTLQLRTPDAKYNRLVEAAWAEWSAEVGLVEKLRTLKLARTVDGEGFLILRTVADMEHPVKLYPVDVEADQVTTPAPTSMEEAWVDGLSLHPVTGRPTAFHVLRYHPGDYYFPGLNPLKADKIAAPFVIHWFPKFRPGQVRGVPVFTSSLDLFAELRSFRRSTVKAAEVAADHSAVLEQDKDIGAPPDSGDDGDGEFESWKRVPIERGAMVMLPPGAKLGQMDPTHPTTTYEMFQEKCLGEACRPLSYPVNLALGTSQKFNFSSAKLDHINYRNGLSVERADCDAAVNDRLFRAWYPEAVLSGAIPVYQSLDKPPPHEWHWPGFEPLDPVADATADHDRRAHGTLTDREFWARRGYDWQDVYAQLAAERDEREKLDLSFGDPVKTTVSVNEDDPDAGPESHDKPAPKPADKQPAETAPPKPSEKVVKKSLATADVQNTALNGAQVASMIAVCDKLVLGDYTGEATRAILKGSFPGLDTDLIDTIVRELEGHVPPARPEPAEAANAG